MGLIASLCGEEALDLGRVEPDKSVYGTWLGVNLAGEESLDLDLVTTTWFGSSIDVSMTEDIRVAGGLILAATAAAPAVACESSEWCDFKSRICDSSRDGGLDPVGVRCGEDDGDSKYSSRPRRSLLGVRGGLVGGENTAVSSAEGCGLCLCLRALSRNASLK